jgi:hypothetical protein
MLFDKKTRINNLRLRGNISLTTVIIVGALLIVSGMAVLANAIDVSMSTKSYFNRTMGDIRVAACLEEGMYKLSRTPTFVGTVSLTYPDGSCQVVIDTIGGDPTKKSLAVTGVFGEFTVTRSKKADTTTSPMTLSN